MILLTGCGNKEYDEAMIHGKEAIEEGNFEEAAVYFKAALEEEADDKTATTYLRQTENMIDGLRFLNEGNLSESEKALESVKREDGSETLVEKANATLKEIISLKETNEEIGKLLSDVKNHADEGEYTEALTLLEQIQQRDLTHSYFNTLTEEIDTIEKDINVKNKLYEETRNAYRDAEKLKEENNYHDALAIINESLSKELEYPGFKTLKTDLESLQSELNDKLAAVENEKKKRALIEAVKESYWVHTEDPFRYCSFTNDAYVCPTRESDIYFYGDITSWDANLENGTVIMHMKDEIDFTTSLSNGLLVLNDGSYKRISKEELSKELGSVTIEEFFDVNVYKQYDGN